MARTHYETLGLKRTATASEIRSAYRKIVLQHHPDRSKAPGSVQIFMAATEAYEVLHDPERKRSYDAHLDAEVRRATERIREQQEQQRRIDEARQATERVAAGRTYGDEPPRPTMASIAADVARLSVIFSRGQSSQAEQLAREILHADPRQPIPYAVLGDLMRARGNIDEAARMYAYAAQFDPRNTVYQRRYEEILSSSRIVTGATSAHMVADDQKVLALMAGIALIFAAFLFALVTQDSAKPGTFTFLSLHALGLILVLFFSGVTVGVSLAVGRYLDRFSAVAVNATGRLGPVVALAPIALVNFWAAAFLYILLGLAQRAFNVSLSRFVGATAGVTLILAAGSLISLPEKGLQVFLWGGNLVYLGGFFGWMIADSLRA